MMDNDDAWMYYHDEVVEQIDLNSMLNTTESICSALDFKLGKSWEPYVNELPKIAVRCTALFDLSVWSIVLKNIGDSKTFFLAKR